MISFVFEDGRDDASADDMISPNTFRNYGAGEFVFVWVTWEGADAALEVYLHESKGLAPDIPFTVLPHQNFGTVWCAFAYSPQIPSGYATAQVRGAYGDDRTERHISIYCFTGSANNSVVFKNLSHQTGTGNVVLTPTVDPPGDGDWLLAHGVCVYHAGMAVTGSWAKFQPGDVDPYEGRTLNRGKDSVGVSFISDEEWVTPVYGRFATTDLGAVWIGSIVNLYEVTRIDEIFDGSSLVERRRVGRSNVSPYFRERTAATRGFFGRSVEEQKE